MAANANTPDFVRVKERFQVTIPASIRRQMDIQEGDFMELRFVNGEIRIKPRPKDAVGVPGADWYRDFCAQNPENPLTQNLTDADVTRLVKTWR
jgi:AbrB family looped-hinge helix DNA binding protein